MKGKGVRRYITPLTDMNKSSRKIPLWPGINFLIARVLCCSRLLSRQQLEDWRLLTKKLCHKISTVNFLKVTEKKSLEIEEKQNSFGALLLKLWLQSHLIPHGDHSFPSYRKPSPGFQNGSQIRTSCRNTGMAGPTAATSGRKKPHLISKSIQVILILWLKIPTHAPQVQRSLWLIGCIKVERETVEERSFLSKNSHVPLSGSLISFPDFSVSMIVRMTPGV